jgi:predicted membrane protein
MHQLVLFGKELFDLRVGLVVGVAALAVAVVSRLKDLRGF